jgi:uncharacterized protein (UPF0264 family)
MQLLVSVADAREAMEALAGGADIIDAKDPRKGALGAVELGVLVEISAALRNARPLTAALGDASDADAIEALARSFAVAGASLVKVGLAGIGTRHRAASLLAATVRGTAADAHESGSRCGVFAVAYADARAAASPSIDEVIALAAEQRCRGLLIDTFDKAGAGLCALLPPVTLTRHAETARRAGLLVALAGRLSEDDLDVVREAGAEVAGVRGAACDGGRGGRIRAGRVRTLQARCVAAAGRY